MNQTEITRSLMSDDPEKVWGRYELLQNLQQLNFLITQATIANFATVQLPRNTR